jgi:multidrug resistance efflux pump
MKRQILIPVVLVLALAGGAWYVFQRQAAAAATVTTFSGTIEADEVDITSEVSGKVDRIAADEGAPVKAGDVLIQINTDLLATQLEQARAAQQVAEANLALLRAGSRSEDIAAAEAQLNQAVAQREGAASALASARASTVITQAQVQLGGAQTALRDARASLADSQELQSQVLQATAARDAAAAARDQAQVSRAATADRLSAAKTQAESAVEQAANALRDAQDSYSRVYWKNRELEKLPGNLPQERIDLEASAQRAVANGEQALAQARTAAAAAAQAEATGNAQAEEQAAAAATALANAQANLDHALAVKASPQQLRSAADAALSQRDSAAAGLEAARVQRDSAVAAAASQLAAAEAAVQQAQARLDAARAGTRAEQVAVAEAQVAQARAQARQLEVQIAKATLTAPADGLVLERVVNLGEVAAPGNVLLKLGSLARVKLTIYVPEDQIGPLQLREGAAVQVKVDSFAERTFPGTVTFIAPQAQFTPRNVQTTQERATTVFPVRIELDNPDGALKPGMPADATVAQ